MQSASVSSRAQRFDEIVEEGLTFVEGLDGDAFIAAVEAEQALLPPLKMAYYPQTGRSGKRDTGDLWKRFGKTRAMRCAF